MAWKPWFQTCDLPNAGAMLACLTGLTLNLLSSLVKNSVFGKHFSVVLRIDISTSYTFHVTPWIPSKAIPFNLAAGEYQTRLKGYVTTNRTITQQPRIYFFIYLFSLNVRSENVFTPSYVLRHSKPVTPHLTHPPLSPVITYHSSLRSISFDQLLTNISKFYLCATALKSAPLLISFSRTH